MDKKDKNDKKDKKDKKHRKDVQGRVTLARDSDDEDAADFWSTLDCKSGQSVPEKKSMRPRKRLAAKPESSAEGEFRENKRKRARRGAPEVSQPVATHEAEDAKSSTVPAAAVKTPARAAATVEETHMPAAATESVASASGRSGSERGRSKELLIELLGTDGAREFVSFARAMWREKQEAPLRAMKAWEAKLRAVLAGNLEQADKACAEVLSRARRGVPCLNGLPVLSFEEARILILRCGGKEALNRDRQRRMAAQAAAQKVIIV